MTIRCKMQLESVFAQSWGGAKAIFRCIYDQNVAEGLSGYAEFQIDNPKAAAQLIIGRYYYVDFTLVPDQS